MSKISVNAFKPMSGEHCETVATGSLLKTIGIELSEPMLFGLGEGLSFVFLNLASFALPFVGGRVKPFELTQTLCRNIGVECRSWETSSRQKSWTTLETTLRSNTPVGLQLDAFYLNYFSIPFHFAGHFVAAYGCDAEQVWVVDTIQQGTLHQVSRSNIEAARFAKGPMAARARAWTIENKTGEVDLPGAIQTAISANARTYLAPKFQGASYLGIRKLSASLPKWQHLCDAPACDFIQAANLMERAGTGGAIFRNFYRDFLLEAGLLLYKDRDLIAEAADLFSTSAQAWTHVASLLEATGKDQSPSHLLEASATCDRIAQVEVSAMSLLSKL